LKPSSAPISSCDGSPRSISTLENPKPCSRPSANATAHRASTVRSRLLSAAATTESAIAVSTNRDGSDTSPVAEITSVIECASVNAVTISSTSLHTSRSESAALHRCVRRWYTAGRIKHSKNRM